MPHDANMTESVGESTTKSGLSAHFLQNPRVVLDEATGGNI